MLDETSVDSRIVTDRHPAVVTAAVTVHVAAADDDAARKSKKEQLEEIFKKHLQDE